jgi:aryl-alcohol dehydrogenase-like predicted oxidoreductase
LSSKVTTKTKFEKFDDVRTWVPQLSKRNIQGNQPIVDLVTRYAEAKGATPAQISLAWMLTKWPHVVPIPGSKNKGRIIENLDASKVELYAEELTALDTELGKLKVYGHRGFSR